jgi:DNA-directed RNA polymerase subunit RPC12/RpoP
MVRTKKKQRFESLAAKHRRISSEWHPKKNGSLDPKEIARASRKKIWWQCVKGHEWQAAVYSRTIGGNGCPYCSGKKAGKDNSLRKLYPKIARQWHKEKNGDLSPSEVTRGSKKKIWWQCSKGHEWQSPVYDRTNGKGCPYCSHRKIGDDNNLAAVDPELAAEWHGTKNRPLKPEYVFPASAHKVWWKCKLGHQWQATINSRSTLGTGCPYCSGRRIAPENSLSKLNRKIALQWDKVKNGSLTPREVSPVSKKMVWWKCRKGHRWQASVRSRTLGAAACPVCGS